ncbi:T9SS type A sorting domain-containing protein [Ohtaekwangia koreensis]|uniref:Por secretion system C-terminal sorting domain-containing protein n=1 Tax=Ohtaekwangia koreensis TaxID=688867 RepID=A0A1T5MNS8_9BACT|nr:T9SS type A sorting domain-containing protein [Ohtaekwangia koreensis]SKC89871.1 Por secretion system C-terminal sorting domain-containing protein [Ohtaekwangia koreensis]
MMIIAGAAALEVIAQEREQNPPVQTEHVDLVKSVHIFPNPAVEFVHIRIDQFKAQDIKLSLHNIIGNEMNTETEIVDEHELRVRVKDLASGYYLLAMKDKDSKFTSTFKFVKK